MKTKLMGIILGLALCGCATSGRKLDQSKVDAIKKGETTRDQVIKLIGSPDQVAKSSSGDTVFTYSFMRATVKGSTFIPIVGAFAGGVDTQNQMVMITFGPDGVVKEYVSTYGASDVSNGLESGSKAKLDGVEKGKRPK
jgi:outer membrane protein assembly factor BamE (lipoprotein component of BamABCDE complex)